MAGIRTIKQGAGGPDLEVTCQERNPDTGAESAVDISAASTKLIRLADDKNTFIADTTATFTTDGTDGGLTIAWPAGAVAAPNDLRVEAHVTLGGNLHIFPDEGYGKAKVTPALPAS